MTALYVLAQEYRAAADQLAELDLDEQTVLDTLEGLAGDLEMKSVNCAFMSRNLDALGDSIDAAIEGMKARSKAAKANAARIRRYMLENMQHAGIQKITGPYFTIAQRENPPAVVIDEPGLIPAEFMRQPEPPPPAPDKTAIKEAIKTGREVPGAHLERGVRLEIK